MANIPFTKMHGAGNDFVVIDNRAGEYRIDGAAAAKLARRRVMAGGGDFYAVRCLSAMGVDPERGVLRLSFTHYTAPEEVALAVDALTDLIGAD